MWPDVLMCDREGKGGARLDVIPHSMTHVWGTPWKLGTQKCSDLGNVCKGSSSDLPPSGYPVDLVILSVLSVIRPETPSGEENPITP